MSSLGSGAFSAGESLSHKNSDQVMLLICPTHQEGWKCVFQTSSAEMMLE